MQEAIGGITFAHTCVEGSCKTSDDGYYPAQDSSKKDLGERKDKLVKEPYTCERLMSVPGGYQLLTPVKAALTFDFTNPQVRTAKLF